MDNLHYDLDEYKQLEETLLQIMSGIERVLEFDVFGERTHEFKDMYKVVGDCYDEVHTKILQITAKNKFENVVKQAKSSYMDLDEIIEIVKRYYSDDKLMA